jgi:hypothetical protein
LAPNEGKKMGLRLSKVGGVAGRSESGGASKSEKARRKDKGEDKGSKKRLPHKQTVIEFPTSHRK